MNTINIKKNNRSENDQIIISKKTSKTSKNCEKYQKNLEKFYDSKKESKNKKKEKKEIKNAWKFIFSFFRHFKKDALVISFLAVVTAIFSAATPVLTGKFIDTISKMEENIFVFNLNNAYFLALLLLLIYLSSDVVNYFREKKSKILAVKATKKYKDDTIEKILNLNFTFHTTRKAGDINSKNSRAAFVIQKIIGEYAPYFIPQVLFLLIAVFIIYSINYILSFVIIIGMFFYSVNVYLSLSKIRKLTKIDNKASHENQIYFSEVVNNILDVKKYNLEKNKFNGFKEYSEKIVTTSSDLYNLQSGNIFKQNIIISSTKILFFIFSIYLFIENKITIGQIVTILMYIGMVFNPLRMISHILVFATQGVEKISDMMKIINLKPENYQPKDYIKLENILGKIEYQKVNFSYPKSVLYNEAGKNKNNLKNKKIFSLKNININIKQGQKVAFVGESGSGKTTAIELIGGFYFPNEGKILVDNIETSKYDLNFLRKNIAYVSQDIILFNDTVENNIRFGDENISKEKVVEAVKLAYADEFIDKFENGYNEMVGDRGIKLSGGQKQRIAIARAILKNPKILILDEPTSALDIKSETFITKSLEKLMKGRTTIIIAHRLSTVRNVDNIFVFKDGKIIEDGNYKKLISQNGEFKKMVDLHNGFK